MYWSELLPELLDAILGKLTEFTDHLRFRCVCRSWLSAARSHRMLPSLPWLYLPQNPATATNLQFYSSSENRVYKIPFPEARGSEIIGSASRFLLIVGSCENSKVLMINPFTGTKARLPDVVHHSHYIVWDYSGSIVVAKYGCIIGAVYCRPGDESWSGIEALTDCYIHRIVYKAGSFYVFDYRTPVCHVLDGETLNLTNTIQLPPHAPEYPLLLSPDDISLSTEDFADNSELCPLSFRVNSDVQESSWSKVTDLDNYALFSRSCCARLDANFCYLTEARGYTGLSNTMISYYTLSSYPKDDTRINCYIYAYNLITGLSNPKGEFRCYATPFWILPCFDTA